MKSATFLFASLSILTIASCIPTNKNKYDTSDPYGYADAGAADVPADASAANNNPLYDTPAVYDNHAPAPDISPAIADPEPSKTSGKKKPAARTTGPSTARTTGSSITHTVARGDSLSKISAKYKVSAAAIKKANRMTSDVVVIGRKLVIPAR